MGRQVSAGLDVGEDDSDLPSWPIDPAAKLDLRARSDEHHRSDALFRDQLAARWAALLPWRDDPTAPYDQQVQAALAVRVRAFDDATDRFLRPRDIRKHQIQRRCLRAIVQPVVVELGGGLSTRYHRIGKDRTCWIEVDVPAAIALRRRLDMETLEHRFLAHSPTDPAWLAELPDIPPTEMLFIAEGARFHADPTLLQSLVDHLGQHYAESTVLLHVRDEAEVIALGLRPVGVWPLAPEYAVRLIDSTAPSSMHSLRDVGMLVEAIVKPPAE
jgi:O-methyltransferase involved in polyketide biosynthesis